MPATSTTSPSPAPRPKTWVLVVDEGALYEVYTSDGRLPSRGAAIRPDYRGRTVLYNDGQRLGFVLLETDFVDYTHPAGRVAEIIVEYDPREAPDA